MLTKEKSDTLSKVTAYTLSKVNHWHAKLSNSWHAKEVTSDTLSKVKNDTPSNVTPTIITIPTKSIWDPISAKNNLHKNNPIYQPSARAGYDTRSIF